MRHPAAVKYAKWVSWLSGIAASVGSAVSLPVELYRTFHALNQSDEEIRTRIENVTAYLEELERQERERVPGLSRRDDLRPLSTAPSNAMQEESID